MWVGFDDLGDLFQPDDSVTFPIPAALVALGQFAVESFGLFIIFIFFSREQHMGCEECPCVHFPSSCWPVQPWLSGTGLE